VFEPFVVIAQHVSALVTRHHHQTDKSINHILITNFCALIIIYS